MMRAVRPRPWLLPILLLGLTGCQMAGPDLANLADLPPLDGAVLVSGGAFLLAGIGGDGSAQPATFGPVTPAGEEPIPLDDVLGVLRQARVFRRAAAEADPERRRWLLSALVPGADDGGELREHLRGLREQGFDWLLVVEQLQDGAIETQGVNGRWPITLSFWLLFGLGALIPDHTFESRATLRVTLRDLQSGAVLHDLVLGGGPVDLSLVERSNLLGFVMSIVVPPFWVHDDEQGVGDSVREVTRRRLLVSLCRDLKSAPTRQRLRANSGAVLELVRRDGAAWLTIDAAESLSQVRLRQDGTALTASAAAAFERAVLTSLRRDGPRFRYQARLDVPLGPGPFQVLVATIAGNVISATLEGAGSP